MADIRATEKPKPHVPPNALRPTLAGGELVIVLIAFMSGLVLLDIRDFSAHNPFDPTTTASRFQAVLPQLLVIALGATGFSRIGDFVAIVVACWMGRLAGGAALLGDLQYALVFLLQLFMLMVAIGHVWGTREVSSVAISQRRRLVGLGASAAVALLWYLLALRA